MQSSSPAISVILPVCNAESTLTAAVDSVLQQSFREFELIIVNDGSVDGSAKILRGYRDPRIRIIDRQVNRGLVAALNDALHEARAEIIARQDSDDVSLPERFAQQRAVLETEPKIGAVGATLKLSVPGRSSAGAWEYPADPLVARWQALFKTPVAHSAVMFRRRQVLGVGGYSEEFRYAEDYDLWSRLLKVADIRSLSRPLVKYALSPGGVSRAKSIEQRAVHCRIAARNMRELLGADVPREVVQRLAIGVDFQDAPTGYDDFIEAATTCTGLFNAFVDSEWGRSSRAALLSDYRDRLFRLARMLPYRLRLRGLHALRSIAPRGAFGLVTAAVGGIRTLNPVRRASA